MNMSYDLYVTGGVKFTIGFLGNPPQNLRKRILLHMNPWTKTANVRFVGIESSPQVRIARIDKGEEAGDWSYVGTDIFSSPKGEPTLNLKAFTTQMPESEFDLQTQIGERSKSRASR